MARASWVVLDGLLRLPQAAIGQAKIAQSDCLTSVIAHCPCRCQRLGMGVKRLVRLAKIGVGHAEVEEDRIVEA